MHTLRRIRRLSRVAALAAVVGTSSMLTGCDDFLEVTNPGAIENPALENPDYIRLMVAGVLGDFQPALAWTAVWSGAFVDELYNHHGYFEYPALERREVLSTHGTYALGIYNGLHRARFMADSTAGRMNVLLADSAGHDLRLARVVALGGYSWVLLGEQMCETPINGSQEMFTSEQLFQTAVQRFDRAIEVAEGARAHAATVSDAKVRAQREAAADSVANLARVGAARASLDLWSFTQDDAHRQKAIQYASQVTPAFQSDDSRGFEYYANYALGTSFAERRRISNAAWEFITAGRWFSLAFTKFEDMNDPRVPKRATTIAVADGTQQFLPNSPLAYSTYTGELPGEPIQPESDIRLASALEARYIIAEAEGLSAANLLFLNQRRAIGGDGALVTTSESEYLAALREQRSRDLYLDSHRLGDLRRYMEQYGIDLFPSETQFGNPNVTYGDQTCWPVPISEENR